MKKFAAMFDMDGVIIDSNPFHKISLEIFCKKYGFTFTEEDLRTKLFGRRNAEWIPLIFGEDLTEEEIEKYSYEKEALFREVYKDDIVPLAGLVDFLKELEAAGIPRAVATSAPPENVDFTLEKTNLEGMFGVKLNSSHVTEGKPHPEIYLNTAKAMGYAPANTVVFEDSLAGVESGKRAGAKVVGIASTHTPEELHQADLVVPDFTHLTVEQVAALFD
ncbi:HAD family phosphatase [Flammeovirgaceae bacterium SG7u.111]|nr:HAD family phosphatase [Flammeovirgaceae bacterium SG7u.132]WPO34648.1 HAD family phosphatase [Flammeovirgaceae bacterium SG7u.111]